MDRSYDPVRNAFPGLADVHLPNPLDPGLFTRAFFPNDGKIRFEAISTAG